MSLWSPGAARQQSLAARVALRAACGAGSMPAGLSGLLLGDDLVAQVQALAADGRHPMRDDTALVRVPLTTEAAGATWVRKRRPATGQATQPEQMYTPGPAINSLRRARPQNRRWSRSPPISGRRRSWTESTPLAATKISSRLPGRPARRAGGSRDHQVPLDSEHLLPHLDRADRGVPGADGGTPRASMVHLPGTRVAALEGHPSRRAATPGRSRPASPASAGRR